MSSSLEPEPSGGKVSSSGLQLPIIRGPSSMRGPSTVCAGLTSRSACVPLVSGGSFTGGGTIQAPCPGRLGAQSCEGLPTRRPLLSHVRTCMCWIGWRDDEGCRVCTDWYRATRAVHAPQTWWDGGMVECRVHVLHSLPRWEQTQLRT